jgi:calcineurin-like phosphoesterase family protein
MTKIFVISDTHFNHANILKFTDEGGYPVRPGFKNVSDMNEFMIRSWNDTVGPEDHVYHLGDVYFGPDDAADDILSRLNGKKRLIVGNHDEIKSRVLQKHFQKMMLWRLFKEHDILLTHVPIHQSEIRKAKYNVHGHIHQNDAPSSSHINVSVEKTGYRPILLDDIVGKYGK